MIFRLIWKLFVLKVSNNNGCKCRILMLVPISTGLRLPACSDTLSWLSFFDSRHCIVSLLHKIHVTRLIPIWPDFKHQNCFDNETEISNRTLHLFSCLNPQQLQLQNRQLKSQKSCFTQISTVSLICQQNQAHMLSMTGSRWVNLDGIGLTFF